MHIESKGTRFLRRQHDSVRFCVLFAVYTVLVCAGLAAGEHRLIRPLNGHFAWLTAQLLGLGGSQAHAAGPVVSLRHFAVEIRNNCNAIYEAGLYAAAVWAYPTSWRARLLGTLAGASVLYSLNVLRIVSLLVVGLWQPAWFEVMHLYVWQTLFLCVVTASWLAWVSRLRPGP